MTSHECDCVVMGGGPAGTTAAAFVARSGYRTVLVEREKMPRPHVGESLMPETYWTLDKLGVLDKLRETAFPVKVGVQFIPGSGRATQPFFFSEHDDRESSRTWHVERSEFDHILFRHAQELGADCRDGMRVTRVQLANGNSHQVTVRNSEGITSRLTARVLVDATGQQSLLANQLRLRKDNPELRKAAIWGHFTGAEQQPAGSPELTVILHTSDESCWFWYIPLHGRRVSIGLVGDKDRLFADGRSPEGVFRDAVEACPELERRLRRATYPSRLRVDREFSYTTHRHAGPGWVLVGDAYGFIDPTYSTGVFLALKSGELAAEAIVEGLQRDDLSGDQLGKWTPAFDRGVDRFRRLVRAFYSPHFEFGSFLKKHPQHRAGLTDLLIGRAFDDEAESLFADLDPMVNSAGRKQGLFS